MRWSRPLFAVSLFVFGVAAVPSQVCSLRWPAFFRGDADAQAELARGVGAWVDRGLSDDDYHTGSAGFDSEWRFGTAMMAELGFGQTALEHPELRERHVAWMRKCADDMLSPAGHRYDTTSWGRDPMDALGSDRGHVAFLGYTDLALSMERLVDPKGPHADENDRLTEAIVRRLEAHPGELIETYPGERYPVDNAAAIGALGLYDRATGADHSALIRTWTAAARKKWIDPDTGLLLQRVSSGGEGVPRGSGTMLAAYFLSFADPELARDLYVAGRDELGGDVAGFHALREYPPGVDGGGDIDSGPIVLGYGVSSTGFALAGARFTGDEATYDAIGATVELFGAPTRTGDELHFVTGGPIGDAILFAMLTAPAPQP